MLPPAASLLPRLIALRRATLLAQAAVLFLAVGWLQMPLPLQKMLAIIALGAAFNLLTHWRLQKGWPLGNWPVSNGELLAQLFFDILTLAALLYYAGGSSNPFVSLFLLPITIAASALPAAHAWLLAALAALAYSLLLFVNQPLPAPHGVMAELDAYLARAAGIAPEHAGHASGFALHVIGMWLNFVLSAIVLSVFLTRMAKALRRRDRELSAAREAALKNEQILAIGTLAAGAAHKLGTPLATMAVVLREAEITHAGNAELLADLRLLRGQVDGCKQIIAQTLSLAGQAHDYAQQAMPVDACIDELLEDWRLIRPQAQLKVRCSGVQPAPRIGQARALQQALLNLLDNAADANLAAGASGPIEFNAVWQASRLSIDIYDQGAGIDAALSQRIGEAFFSTKAKPGAGGGLGVGFFLSNATLERLGGSVELLPRPTGGTHTRISLPLSAA